MNVLPYYKNHCSHQSPQMIETCGNIVKMIDYQTKDSVSVVVNDCGVYIINKMHMTSLKRCNCKRLTCNCISIYRNYHYKQLFYCISLEIATILTRNAKKKKKKQKKILDFYERCVKLMLLTILKDIRIQVFIVGRYT